MDNVRISRLEISQIGPFGNLTIEFPAKPAGMTDRAEVHILTGENGTGKTTVLEILADGVSKKASNLSLKCRSQDTELSKFQISFGDQGDANWSATGNRFNADSPPARFIKSMNAYPNGTYGIAFFAYSGQRQIGRVGISGIQEIVRHPFEESLNFQNSINPQTILQWVANSIASEAIARTQGKEQEAVEHRNAISQLESTLGSIIGKSIKFILDTRPFGVRIEVEHETLDFNLLPDGLKSIVSWIADLLMRMDRVKWKNDTPVFERNFILFLDEIEVHLHPAWQRKILPAVQSLFPNAQIFISTHSPFVVGSVDGAWIHKFVKPNGDSQMAGPPVLSEDAMSFRYWLGEIFDIKKEFGEGAERQLDEFYRLRDSLLINGTPQERKQFTQLASDLSVQSREMESIVSWEIRQFNKRTQQPVEI